MVTDSWKNIKLICGNHKEDYSNEMQLHEGRAGMSVFYTCPCYNADEKGHKCNNRLNIVDYEGMLDKIMDEYISDDGMETDLTGLKWSRKGVDYHVLSHEQGHFVVVVKNKKAIGK